MQPKFSRFLRVPLMVLLVLLLELPMVSAANGITIELDAARYRYDGTPKCPAVTVTQNGAPVSPSTYNISYGDNTDVGTASVTVSAADGTWEETVLFSIDPRELTAADFSVTSCTKPFDASRDAAPDIRVTACTGDDVRVASCDAHYNDKWAGTNKIVTVQNLTLTGVDAKNYTTAPGLQLVGQGQITQRVMKVQPTVTLSAGETLDLRTLVTGAHDFLCDMTTDSLGSTLSGKTFLAGAGPGTVRLTVQALEADLGGDSTPEYLGNQAELTITILADTMPQPPVPSIPDPPNQEEPPVTVQKQEQADVKLTGPTSTVYGQPVRFTVTGGSGTGAVTYHVLSADNIGAGTIRSDGTFTPTQAGKVRITATKAGDVNYRDRTADAIELTIRQAPITITVDDKTAVVGEELPRLTVSDYTVHGLLGNDRLTREPTLRYAGVTNTERTGIYSILAADAQVPNANYDPNIRYEYGTLTISPAPLYTVRVERPTGGTLTADPTTAEPGTTITVTATVDEGYQLDGITVTGPTGTVRVTETNEHRWTFSMPEGNVTVRADIFALRADMPFTDVTAIDWFHDAVAWVYQQGLMNGTSATTFSPSLTTTRGMIVTILYRLEGSPEAPAWSPFGDVPKDMYYASPIAWAAWHGIVNGKTASSFAPEDPITREQLAAILYRYADTKGSVIPQGDLSDFRDQDKISPYAVTALSWSVGEGLLNGKGDGILDPKGPATRAEAAAILMRFCQNILQ